MSSIASIIEIVLLPHGDAPDEVKKGWIGCVMPCEPECGHVPTYAESVVPRPKRKGGLTVEEFRALPPTEKIDGFSVPTEIAMRVLEHHSPSSADWFKKHGYPKKNTCFRFKFKEVKVLRTITREEEMRSGPLAVYDDMETGTMRRMT